MKRVRNVPNFATLIGLGFAFLLFSLGLIGGLAYGDLRIAQSEGTGTMHPSLFGGLAICLFVVGAGFALHLRHGFVMRTQTVADKVFTLSRGKCLEPFTHKEEKLINAQILTALRLVSDQLDAAQTLKKDEAALLERAKERDAQSRRFRHNMEDVFSKAAGGDFSARLSVPEDRPELKDFCDRINRLLSNIQTSFGSIKETMGLIAKGQLQSRMEQNAQGDFKLLEQDVNKTLKLLLDFINELKVSSASVSEATHRITIGSETLASQVEEQARSLSEASSLMDHISKVIVKSSSSVTQADALTSKAADQAESGSGVVSDAISAMERIENNSDRISDIISVIEGIAFQTNLLALNTAVEAARAGDAGKGFAVVASEVRNLAQRASDAAKDITDLIQQSSGDVENGVRLVKHSGEVLNEIADSVRQVASAMSDINDAGTKQASSVQEVSATIKALDEANGQSVTLADEAAADAQLLEGQADHLNRLLKRFSSEDTLDSQWQQTAEAARTNMSASLQNQSVVENHTPKPEDATLSSTKNDEVPNQSLEQKEPNMIRVASNGTGRSSDGDWAEF